MLGIVERPEGRQLCRQVGPVAAGPAPPERLVILAVKALDNAIAPGLPAGDKDDLHPQIQAQADEEAETTRAPVGPAQGEFVVHLQVAGTAQFRPGTSASTASVACVLGLRANATAWLWTSMGCTP